MTAHPEFLARLGLEEGADERQVRRAYARELKLIDQERDLEGFQYLRACYEAALSWTARRAARAEPAPAEEAAAAIAQDGPAGSAGSECMAQADAPPSAPLAADPVHPAALANGVLEDFCARMAALAARPERMVREETARVEPFAAALREALADPRLLHLDARVIFEHRLAALLADGWRPGHHLLLPAAIEAFGWDGDRRALERLGHAGALLDEALDQRAMFQSQDILARTQQREVLALMRQGQQPDERTVRGYVVPLTTLTNYFPTLLGIVAPHEAAAAWRARLTDDVLRSIGSNASQRALPWWKRGKSPRWVAGVAIFLLIRLVATFGTHDTPHGFSRPDEAERRERLRHPKEIYEDEPVTAERIEAIRRGIVYRPGKDVPPGEQAVVFQVVLDADGSVLGLNALKMPSDPAYAAAVEQAIRATGPFPPKTSKAFRIGFHVDVKRKSVAQAGADAGLPPVTPERMAEIRRRIDYRPGNDVPPGEQRVRFQVVLDDAGAIRRMNVVMMPGDPAYAEAVERAIRSTAPFPPETARSFSIGFRTVKLKPAAPSAPPAGDT